MGDGDVALVSLLEQPPTELVHCVVALELQLAFTARFAGILGTAGFTHLQITWFNTSKDK